MEAELVNWIRAQPDAQNQKHDVVTHRRQRACKQFWRTAKSRYAGLAIDSHRAVVTGYRAAFMKTKTIG